jgi:PAS domain S-box-containing protein
MAPVDEGGLTLVDRESDHRSAAPEAAKPGASYLKAVLDNVLDGIISIDEERIVQTFNPAAERIFGYAAVEVIGQNVRMLMPEPYRSAHDRYVQNYLRTGRAQIIGRGRQVRGRRKNGQEFPLDLAVSEMRVDGQRQFIGIVRDITERQHAEDELRRLNDELEQRVRERTAQLDASNQALQRSLADLRRTQDQLVQTGKMAALGELVSGVAHEINTPVGICVTAASWLQMKLDALAERLGDGRREAEALRPLVGPMQEAAASILTNLARAADLVQSFKQVAVDQATEDQRRFNLKDYIDMLLLSLRPKFKRTGHRLEVECPEGLTVVGYPGAISQIITNLVVNSLLHGFEGLEQGRITLAVSVVDDRVVLRYADNGRGMAAETLRKIYDPFFTTKRAQGGSGLGMHIVYHLVVRRLNGRIDCDSSPGKGSVFTITFPREAHSKESLDAPPA